jgi:Calcineurin-like phosphoesterase
MTKKPTDHKSGTHAGHAQTATHPPHRKRGHAGSDEGDGTADGDAADVLHAGSNQAGGELAHSVEAPQFSQPEATPDPTKFRVRHPSDNAAYKKIDALAAAHKLKPMGFPLPRGGTEPMLKLADILGSAGAAIEQEITRHGQIVFHSVGDTGNTKGPDAQNEVADKMAADFSEEDPSDVPQFYFHLGDVVYSFGESAYYYDQFYDPYRNYPAPILALAGNHDGMVAPDTNAPTLQAFLENFCEPEFVVTPEAGGLNRTAQIQPGVFFTFEAPFVRILALYSNTLEDPGVISSQDGTFPGVPDAQLDYLRAALTRLKTEKYACALIGAYPT